MMIRFQFVIDLTLHADCVVFAMVPLALYSFKCPYSMRQNQSLGVHISDLAMALAKWEYDGNKRDLVFFPIEHGGKA